MRHRKSLTQEVPAVVYTPLRTSKISWGNIWIAGGLLLVVISVSAFGIMQLPPSGQSVGQHFQGPSGMSIDGDLVFDTNRVDANLKLQAAKKVKQGEYSQATSLLQKAIQQDSSDAEARIYLENQYVLSSHHYITLVVGTILSGEYLTMGRGDLQGAFIAQQEYNQQAQQTGSPLLRLVVAVTTPDTTNTLTIAQQVVQLAHKDSTLIGVMGWPTSPTTLAALRIFSTSNPPLIMISETATSDDLTAIAPNFFRVVPPDTAQAIVGAKYAEELHARHVALFVDPGNDYSKSLADAFFKKFLADGYTVIKELYTVGMPETIPDRVHDALSQHVDAFYFAGYAGDANILLQHLPSCSATSCLQIIGGDGLDILGDYKPSVYAYLPRLHMTTFTSPDQWQTLGLPIPPFFREYERTFGAQRLENDVIFAYDAVYASLHAYTHARALGRTSLTPQDFLSQSFDGASGTIAFGTNGNPTSASVIMLSVDQDRHTSVVNTTPVSSLGI